MRAILLCFIWIPAILQAAMVRSAHVEVELMAEVEAVQPGVPFAVGLRMAHDLHWHTYWINPADSGLETMLQWSLPAGVVVGDVRWPYPERIVMEPLVTFGYERDLLLVAEMWVPDHWDAESIEIGLRADWLECKDICLPGGANLTLTLPVSVSEGGVKSVHASLFDAARSEWPQPAGEGSASAQLHKGRIVVSLQTTDDIDLNTADFFPLDGERVLYLPPQNWTATAGGYTFELLPDTRFAARDDPLLGVVVFGSGATPKAVGLEIPFVIDLSATGTEITGLGLALVFAFLGGLILNLMPCVFPVISMKIMGFVRQAEEEHAAVWKHGLIFALGVMVSFWALAGALIALRLGGEQLGWGFHLQSPLFLSGMAVLFFLLSLNLFGVFEVGATWLGLGQKATGKSTWAGSFFSGALATVIATPCTAPFMGAALGYALTLSPLQAMLIFSFLGLGMASPYVLLSARPGWLSKIPKPGPWMETLKQSLGWLLMATVLWLVWVLNLMAGGDAVMLLAGVLFMIGLAAWILGRWGAIHRDFPVRSTAKALAVLIILASMIGGFLAIHRLGPSEVMESGTSGSGMDWEVFSEARLAELRAAGRPVFINFTAAWCLSCQVNERVAFSSDRVQQAFADKGIVPLKADWTARDDRIGRVLAGYGRNSVPFYILYGPNGDSVTLPELLTPGVVLDALEKLKW